MVDTIGRQSSRGGDCSSQKVDGAIGNAYMGRTKRRLVTAEWDVELF